MPKIILVEFHSNVNVKDSVFIFCSTFLFFKIDCQWSLTFLVRLVLFFGLSSSATQQGQCCYFVVNVNVGKTIASPQQPGVLLPPPCGTELAPDWQTRMHNAWGKIHELLWLQLTQRFLVVLFSSGNFRRPHWSCGIRSTVRMMFRSVK